jgi:hypothetical protein
VLTSFWILEIERCLERKSPQFGPPDLARRTASESQPGNLVPLGGQAGGIPIGNELPPVNDLRAKPDLLSKDGAPGAQQ